MTRTLGRALLAIGVYAALLNSGVLAQDKHDHDHGHGDHAGHDHDHAGHDHDHGGDMGMDPEMMERMMKAGMPGEHHKHLDQFVGQFDYVIKHRMAAEGPWMESTGESKSRWVMGGRYVIDDTVGKDPAMPFAGMGITGYDNQKKQYVSVWLDNMSTGLTLSHGTCDSSGKEFTFSGKMDNPMTGNKNEPYKYVIRMINNQKHVMEWWGQGPDGKMFQSMEITYTRKG